MGLQGRATRAIGGDIAVVQRAAFIEQDGMAHRATPACVAAPWGQRLSLYALSTATMAFRQHAPVGHRLGANRKSGRGNLLGTPRLWQAQVSISLHPGATRVSFVVGPLVTAAASQSVCQGGPFRGLGETRQSNPKKCGARKQPRSLAGADGVVARTRACSSALTSRGFLPSFNAGKARRCAGKQPSLQKRVSSSVARAAFRQTGRPLRQPRVYGRRGCPEY